MCREKIKYFQFNDWGFLPLSKLLSCKRPVCTLLIIILIFLFESCIENPINDKDHVITPPVISPLYFSYLAWHPTSNWIAVVHSDSVDTNNNGIDDDFFSGIWLIDAETGEKKPFLDLSVSWIAWSKDGYKLAIVIGGQIYTINIPGIDPIEIDTASLTQLTFEGGNFFPSFSPDGEWITYDSNKDSPTYDIWKMRVDGSEKEKIRDTTDWGGGRIPNWSFNNNQIVYQTFFMDRQAGEIALMDTSGIIILRLTKDELNDRHPRFSRSGEIIGFLSQPLNGPRAIRLINSDGTNVRRISPDWAYLFDFSPDGSKIAFVLNGPDSSVTGNGQLWTMNTDGSNVFQLTDFKP